MNPLASMSRSLVMSRTFAQYKVLYGRSEREVRPNGSGLSHKARSRQKHRMAAYLPDIEI
jgi:hypothetical protein